MENDHKARILCFSCGKAKYIEDCVFNEDPFKCIGLCDCDIPSGSDPDREEQASIVDYLDLL